jgi:tRNA (Thr-GGU) A37 N-methylase
MIRTPFIEAAGTPIQPGYGRGVEGQVSLDERYAPALDDVEGFERIWLIYWMDRAQAFNPRVVPYRDTQEHGLFATRAPTTGRTRSDCWQSACSEERVECFT